MSLTTLVTFVEVFSVDINNNRSTKHRLQNAKREPSENSNSANNTILFNGQNYHYLPFIYQGTTINRSGDNIESNLIMGNHSNSNWWIWKVFWILLIVTAVEVALGIIKPPFMMEVYFGTKLINHIFIILTLIKAAYIVMEFMHLGQEKKGLKLVILLPALILIPYMLFILLTEGLYASIMI